MEAIIISNEKIIISLIDNDDKKKVQIEFVFLLMGNNNIMNNDLVYF